MSLAEEDEQFRRGPPLLSGGEENEGARRCSPLLEEIRKADRVKCIFGEPPSPHGFGRIPLSGQQP